MSETSIATPSGQAPFFVLDIGTRFVRGLVCQALPEAGAGGAHAVRVLDAELIEHETRAMRAGQIHDIGKAARVVCQIIKRLEARAHVYTDNPRALLSKVSVAVAGRNLITRRGRAEHMRTEAGPIGIEDVKSLELRAVQKALEELATESEYYCVGYSSCGHWLDGEEISSLLDHRGARIASEVLVTLLPRQVLEAMFEACAKAGLEIEHLTLEPIAALESALTESMRALDTILVDIGAGTSDIAVVSHGRVQSYGMVPMAGDSLTEALSAELLIDFNEAERIKRLVGNPEFLAENATLTFRDIFDRHYQQNTRDLFAKLRPAVTVLASRIAAEIKALTPMDDGNYALILVGGGSLTPMLEQDLAEAVGLPPHRVGKRSVGLNRDIEDCTGVLAGPDSATVAGIALLYARRAGLKLTHMTLNGKRITLINPESAPTILSVLLSNGIGIRQIYGRVGMAKTITVKGALVSLKGELPLPSLVSLNGQAVPLETHIKEGDTITFVPAVDGKDAHKTVREIVSLPSITFNGKQQPMPVRITMDGQPVSLDVFVHDRAVIQYEYIVDVNGVLEFFGINKAMADEKGITVEVNGQFITLRSNRYVLKHNHVDIDINKECLIAVGDELEFRLLDPQWKIEDITAPPTHGKDLHVRINGEDCIIPGGKGIIMQNGEEVPADHLLSDGDSIRTIEGKDADAVLVDVFRYLEVEPHRQTGKRMRLLVNNQESQFTTPLFEDADIQVLFVPAEGI